MSECAGNFYILNGELKPSRSFNNDLVNQGVSVYEVIRVVNGIPLFFSDHFLRLESSVRLQSEKMPAGSEELRKDIISLLTAEPKNEINIKIVFNYNKGSENRLVYFINTSYPTSEQYRDGVKGILFHAVRNDPQSKVLNNILRSEIYIRLDAEGAYEALLVNSEGSVTEGSRSNIFFIKEDTLFTAPDSDVLSGITRKHIIEICRVEGFNIVYECVKADRISDYDCVLMTGTSPVVLPFHTIDNIGFSVDHPYIALLRKLYLERAEASMRDFMKL